jgi:hypothetical protein
MKLVAAPTAARMEVFTRSWGEMLLNTLRTVPQAVLINVVFD